MYRVLTNVSLCAQVLVRNQRTRVKFVFHSINKNNVLLINSKLVLQEENKTIHKLMTDIYNFTDGQTSSRYFELSFVIVRSIRYTNLET
jgi:hypothetical protein